MTLEHIKEANQIPEMETAEEIMRYGITLTPIDNYYYRGFHYTNFKDAVAQARRDNLLI